jgi:hypothetical protein
MTDQPKRSSFTDQKPRVAIAADLAMRWGNAEPGARFRCYLCGHRFKVGDVWRWVCGSGAGVVNFFTCETCDGDDVLARFLDANREHRTRFWWWRR